MSKYPIEQTAWGAGEITPRLHNRPELQHYEFGAMAMDNFIVSPHGGMVPVPGNLLVANIPGAKRALAFSFATGGFVYTLVFLSGSVQVWRNGALRDTVTGTPWVDDEHLEGLYGLQLNDVLFIASPGLETKLLRRVADDDWILEAFSWYVSESGAIEQPYWKYEAADLTMDLGSAAVELTNMTASAPYFTASHVGMQFRVKGSAVNITGYVSPTVVNVSVLDAVEGGHAATGDWAEPMFSALRGWPRVLGWFQNRMVLAGADDLRNGYAMSRPDELYNFKRRDVDLVVADDHAIVGQLIDRQFQSIQAFILRGRQLFVQTSGGIWVIEAPSRSSGFGPKNREQNLLPGGAAGLENTQPIALQGSILYAGLDGKQLVEASEKQSASGEQIIASRDLAIPFEHLMRAEAGAPIKRIVRLQRPFQYIVALHTNGKLTWVQYQPDQNSVAPTPIDYGVNIIDICVLEDTAHVLMLLTDAGELLQVDNFYEHAADPHAVVFTSRSVYGESETAVKTWAGLDHFQDGDVVTARADGTSREGLVVTGGTVTLPEAAFKVSVGAAMQRRYKPLPIRVHGQHTPTGPDQGARVRSLVAVLIGFVETELVSLLFNGERKFVRPDSFLTPITPKDFTTEIKPEQTVESDDEHLTFEIVVTEASYFQITRMLYEIESTSKRG